MRLIIARHGRTAANVTKALDTRPPGAPLDEVGRAQAAELAGRLATEPLTAVYASRAIRAQQTAEAVAARHGLDVVAIDGVQEVSAGDLEGRSDIQARERFEGVYQAWLRGELDAHLPGGESALDVVARYGPAVTTITEAATGPVLLVGHGAAIRVAVGAMLGEGAKTRYMPNAGVVILDRTPDGWAVEHWDGGRPIAGDVTGGAETGW